MDCRFFVPLLLVLLTCSVAKAEVFEDQFEKDFSIRSFGELQVTNLRGGIEIRGWSQDKIRVRARRKVRAEGKEEANKLFSALDVRFLGTSGALELSAEYGKNLTIEERLRERKSPRTSMELLVLAPAGLKLKVWSMEGRVSVKDWSDRLEVRTGTGAVDVEGVSGSVVSLLCPSCSIRASSVKGVLRCMGGSGRVDLKDIDGKEIFVETHAGSISASGVRGGQLYVSKTGNIKGDRLSGNVEFHTTAGSVRIDELNGFASGTTQEGPIDVRVRQWRFSDKALFESNRGKIRLEFPASFSGEVDLWSLYGKARLDFSLVQSTDYGVYGPEPRNHLRGRVGDGGEQLRAFSQEGDVTLTRIGSH